VWAAREKSDIMTNDVLLGLIGAALALFLIGLLVGQWLGSRRVTDVARVKDDRIRSLEGDVQAAEIRLREVNTSFEAQKAQARVAESRLRQVEQDAKQAVQAQDSAVQALKERVAQLEPLAAEWAQSQAQWQIWHQRFDAVIAHKDQALAAARQQAALVASASPDAESAAQLAQLRNQLADHQQTIAAWESHFRTSLAEREGEIEALRAQLAATPAGPGELLRDLNQLTAELDTVRAQLADREQRLEAAGQYWHDQLQQRDRELAALRGAAAQMPGESLELVAELRAELARKSEEARREQALSEALERELRERHRALDEREERLEALEQELKQAGKSRAKLEHALTQQELAAGDLPAMIVELRAELARKSEEARREQALSDALERELRERHQALDEREERLEALEQELKQAGKSRAKLEQALAEQEKAAGDLPAMIVELRGEVVRKSEEARRAQALADQLERQLQAEHAALDEREEVLASVSSQVTGLSRARQQLETQLTSLGAQSADLAHVVAEVRAELTRKDEEGRRARQLAEALERDLRRTQQTLDEREEELEQFRDQIAATERWWKQRRMVAPGPKPVETATLAGDIPEFLAELPLLVAELQADLARKDEEARRATALSDHLSDDLRAALRKLDEAEEDLASLRGKMHAAERWLAERRAQGAAAEDAALDLQAVVAELQADLARKDEEARRSAALADALDRDLRQAQRLADERQDDLDQALHQLERRTPVLNAAAVAPRNGHGAESTDWRGVVAELQADLKRKEEEARRAASLADSLERELKTQTRLAEEREEDLAALQSQLTTAERWLAERKADHAANGETPDWAVDLRAVVAELQRELARKGEEARRALSLSDALDRELRQRQQLLDDREEDWNALQGRLGGARRWLEQRRGSTGGAATAPTTLDEMRQVIEELQFEAELAGGAAPVTPVATPPIPAGLELEQVIAEMKSELTRKHEEARRAAQLADSLEREMREREQKFEEERDYFSATEVKLWEAEHQRKQLQAELETLRRSGPAPRADWQAELADRDEQLAAWSDRYQARVAELEAEIAEWRKRAAEVSGPRQSELDRLLRGQPIQFMPMSAEMLAESLPVVEAIAGVLRQHPDAKVEIGGHTDSWGDPQENLKLSQRRAAAVKAQLVTLGIDEGRMTDLGFGDTKPVADNTTAEGRFQNRRIEFLWR
jgi:outer membrane protein OmpA-like peptidoglycan-associated protein/DNA repair exonuclease SbcCD ATPase subunit